MSEDQNPQQHQSRKLVIAGIAGSIRPGSYTRMAVETALAGAAEAGADTRLLDLESYDLVLCNGEKDARHYPSGVARMRADVAAADGLILGTPEYHGHISGVLKNAIDLMGFPEFEGKMLGLVGVSGGAMGGLHALISLRSIGRALHAWVIPEQVVIPHARMAFDGDGKLKDARIAERVSRVGHQVARFARLHTVSDACAFLDAWERAPENPGGAPENPADTSGNDGAQNG